MRLPMRIDDITVEWVNAALASAGHGTPVRAVRTGEFIGGAASKVRLHLEYREPSALPPTMILKTCLEAGREALMEAGFYHREARFYRAVRDRYDIRAPICYFAGEQQDPPQGAVLIEDLGVAGISFGTPFKPYSAGQVASALAALANLHARSMNDPGVADLAMPLMLSETVAIFDAIIDNADASFGSIRGYAIPFSLHDAHRLRAGMAAYQAMVQSETRCLLHGDTHVGNTYVRADGELAWLDWQLPGRGHWVHDVAYFMGGALDIPERRLHERDLIQGYLDAARQAGGDMPSFDMAWDAYRRALFYGFIVWLGTDPAHQPDTVCVANISRFGAAMLDHDVYGLLGV